jgi:hypothetical protein|tara:strand:+ start:465 stop:767 length:303 start_codon:yes stop_codon:yes gene_type:complete
MEKELQNNIKEKQEISLEKDVEKKAELVGRIFPHNNHQVFEINNKTLCIELAKFEYDNYVFNKGVINKKIVIHKDCSYVSALNKKNALKKFKKGNNGSKI